MLKTRKHDIGRETVCECVTTDFYLSCLCDFDDIAFWLLGFFFTGYSNIILSVARCISLALLFTAIDKMLFAFGVLD